MKYVITIGREYGSGGRFTVAARYRNNPTRTDLKKGFHFARYHGTAFPRFDKSGIFVNYPAVL